MVSTEICGRYRQAYSFLESQGWALLAWVIRSGQGHEKWYVRRKSISLVPTKCLLNTTFLKWQRTWHCRCCLLCWRKGHCSKLNYVNWLIDHVPFFGALCRKKHVLIVNLLSGGSPTFKHIILSRETYYGFHDLTKINLWNEDPVSHLQSQHTKLTPKSRDWGR